MAAVVLAALAGALAAIADAKLPIHLPPVLRLAVVPAVIIAAALFSMMIRRSGAARSRRVAFVYELVVLGFVIAYIVVLYSAAVGATLWMWATQNPAYVLVATLIPVAVLILPTLFRHRGSKSRPPQAKTLHEFAFAGPDAPAPVDLSLGDDTLLDITSRYNESLVANIDAIDTALIAILALPVAFGVFAVDKIFDLPAPWSAISMIPLGLSVVVGFVGYAWGVFIRGGRHGTRDGINPTRFLAAYSLAGASAVAEAIRTGNRDGEQNRKIRQTKRLFALVALLLFIFGTAAIFGARMVQKAAETKQPVPCRCEPSRSPPTGARGGPGARPGAA